MAMTDKAHGKLNPQESDGLVWILDGQIHVKNETKRGIPPLIDPCDGVKLIINGIEYNHLTSVSEKDVIELIPLDSETEMNIDIEITDNGLKAFINYIPPQKVRREIIDTYPMNKLDIKCNEIVLEVKQVFRENIINTLKGKGIVFGIISSTIDEICMVNTAGRYLVAEGKFPTEPVDDEIEYFFDDSCDKEISLEEDSSGSIDYRNIANYIAVKPGDLLAQIYYGQPAGDGMTVKGDIIRSHELKKIAVLPSDSITIDNSTGVIRARKSGRPSKIIEGRKVKFNIFEKLILDEVSIKTGNVRFKGDIEINGNVSESMEVVAKGNVFIKGNVGFASIFSRNNITILKSAISSKIDASLTTNIFKDPAQEINKIKIEIENLIKNINQITHKESKSSNMRSMPELVRHLLNTQNKLLPGTIYEVITNIRDSNYDIDKDTFSEFIKKVRVFLHDCSEVSSIGYLYGIVEELNTLFALKEEEKKGALPSSNVTVDYVLNSEISAAGDIIVTGRGCFNSKLYAKGRIVISGNVRGGEIKSEKSIDVNTVGSDIGVKTILTVPENSNIRINIAYTDTIIKIGNISHRFLNQQELINAKVINNQINF